MPVFLFRVKKNRFWTDSQKHLCRRADACLREIVEYLHKICIFESKTGKTGTFLWFWHNLTTLLGFTCFYGILSPFLCAKLSVGKLCLCKRFNFQKVCSCPAVLTCGCQAESKAYVENTGWASKDPDYLKLRWKQHKSWAFVINRPGVAGAVLQSPP